MAKDYQGLSESFLEEAANRYRQIGSDAEGMGGQLEQAWSGTMKPLASSIVASAGYRPDMASQAGIDTQLQYENVKGQMERNASRMGINPNSGRFGGLMQQWGLALAAARAGSKTRAERQERDSVFTRMLQAGQTGSGILSGMGSALGSKMSALNTSAAGLRGIAGDWGDIAAGQGEFGQLGNLGGGGGPQYVRRPGDPLPTQPVKRPVEIPGDLVKSMSGDIPSMYHAAEWQRGPSRTVWM